MVRPLRVRTLRTPAAVALAGSLALTAVSGGAAWAAIPPRDLAFILAPEIALQPPASGWKRFVTIRQTGEVAGHPGNRHTVTVEASTFATSPGYLQVNIRIQDDECDATGTCRPVAAGEAQVPSGAAIPPVGPDGSVHLEFDVPGSLVRSTLEGGVEEFADADLDLTITPVGWRPRPPLTTVNAEVVRRFANRYENRVSAERTVGGSSVRASGTAAGVRAVDVVGGSWEDTDLANGTSATNLPPTDGTTGLAPYVPPIRGGAVVHETMFSAAAEQNPAAALPAGASLVTSTGYRLPGDTYAFRMGGIVNLAAGDPAAATAAMPPKTQTELFLWVYQCTPAPCRRVTDVRVAPAPGLDYRIWPNGRVRLKGTAVVTSTENGETIDRGTLDFVVDGVPAGPGSPARSGSLNRETREWTYGAGVGFNGLAGTVTLAGVPLQPPKAGGQMAYGRRGTL